MQKQIANKIRMMEDGLKTGIGLGLGYIFLTLIGIPSSDSQQLAALTIPIFLLLAFGMAWVISREKIEFDALLANSIALGSGAAIILLVFMGQMNSWHAKGVDVTNLYFARMNTYPVQVMSGVPQDELFPSPEIDPVTGEYPEDAQFRTNPMSLRFSEQYAVMSLAGLHIGGLYGTGLLILLLAVVGGVAQFAFRRIDWQGLRDQFSSEAREQTGAMLWHWGIILLPLIFMALFWLTIPQTFTGDMADAIHVIDLNDTFNLTSASLIDEASMQLGIAFLIVISALFSIRQAEATPSNLGYPARAGIAVGVVVFSLVLALLRIENHNVTFFSPSFDLGVSGHDLSLALTILIGLALIVYALRANRDADQFQVVMAMLIAAIVVLISPLYMTQYQTFIMGRVALAVMLGLGLNIVVGQAGLLDLGYVAFYAVGAYTFALLAIESDRSLSVVDVPYLNNAGWSLVAAMIVAPLVMFIGTNIWRNRAPAPKPAELKTQSVVWDNAPPWFISLGLIALVVVLTFLLRGILDNLFDVGEFSSFLIVLVVAFIMAAFVGFLLGIPVLRLRGDYLAIVTLGFGEIISLALRNLDSVTGGPSGAIGIPKPVPTGTPLVVTNLTMLYLGMVGAGIVMLMSLRLRDSRIGRAWYALRSDEDIAQAMGINLVNVKLLAFSIGAALAGLAGMLFASRQNSIFPDDFGLEVSINVLALVIIGGMGSIPGVVIGSIALIGLPELLRPVADYRIMAFGLLLIVSMILLPKGLLPSPPPSLEDKARQLAESRSDEDSPYD